MQTSKFLTSAAHILSDVFMPLFVPTYGMIIAMWFTPLQYLPLSTRIWSTAAIALMTAIIPMIVIGSLMKMGKVSDPSISNPKQRTIPYLTSIICYAASAIYLMSLHAEYWLTAFYAGAGVVSLLSLIITSRWKISAHTGAVGGLAAIIFWLGRAGYLENPLLWVSGAFMLVGLIAWSRLYLERHTLLQVFAGAVMSFAIEYAIIAY